MENQKNGRKRPLHAVRVQGVFSCFPITLPNLDADRKQQYNNQINRKKQGNASTSDAVFGKRRPET